MGNAELICFPHPEDAMHLLLSSDAAWEFWQLPGLADIIDEARDADRLGCVGCFVVALRSSLCTVYADLSIGSGWTWERGCAREVHAELNWIVTLNMLQFPTDRVDQGHRDSSGRPPFIITASCVCSAWRRSYKRVTAFRARHPPSFQEGMERLLDRPRGCYLSPADCCSFRLALLCSSCMEELYAMQASEVCTREHRI